MAPRNLRFLDLGGIEPIASQAIYEAVAVARQRGIVADTLIICWPNSPLVCVGYFQEVEKELDVKYCESRNVPIVRRILGGGAVYLDSNQVFYQIIGERGGNIIPVDIEAVFRKMLEAPIRAYKEMGIPVVYRPVNDIEVEGRKISGNGAGEIDGIAILTGNIILDFNYNEMTRILKVPDEKFRDKLTKSLRERVTTVKRELGSAPNRKDVKDSLVKHFQEVLGVELTLGSLSTEENSLLRKLVKEKYLSKKWTYGNSGRRTALSQPRIVKVSGQTIVGQGTYKSVGGLIRVTAEFRENRINEILISGDFTFLPPKIPELEEELLKVDLDEQILVGVIKKFYDRNKIASPGTTPGDFAEAIMIASGTRDLQ
ncbi:MAG: biotin/lipoate A/B protein ligase family protein [Promethearchaeati archaeon SRVP18_Atabeyarchaeia-1]